MVTTTMVTTVTITTVGTLGMLEMAGEFEIVNINFGRTFFNYVIAG